MENPFKNNLESKIEALYSIFKRYRLYSAFHDRCSPLGERQDLAKRLAGTPLRATSATDVAVYSFKALTTMGDGKDYKHFLPRMFELVSTSPEWYCHMTLLPKKLNELGWLEWPRVEIEAIKEFIDAQWDYILNVYPWHSSATAFLLEVSVEFGVLQKHLAKWENCKNEASLLHFIEALKHEYGGLEEFDNWLLNESNKKRLEHSYQRHETSELSVTILEALELFEHRTYSK